MSQTTCELFKFDLSLNLTRLSSSNNFSSQVRIVKCLARKLTNLFKFTYIFDNIIFIYNSYI